MTSLHFSRVERNHISTYIEFSNQYLDLPFFPRMPATAAGLYLQRRYRVSAGIADLIAELAGLGELELRA
jgi:hypothetical protein